MSSTVKVLGSARTEADFHGPVRRFLVVGNSYAECMAALLDQLDDGQVLVSVEAVHEE